MYILYIANQIDSQLCIQLSSQLSASSYIIKLRPSWTDRRKKSHVILHRDPTSERVGLFKTNAEWHNVRFKKKIELNLMKNVLDTIYWKNSNKNN